MDNRKRPRLEISRSLCGNGSSGSLASAAGQNIFIGNGDVEDVLPANVFLTICDENSAESQEFLELGSNVLNLKDEPDVVCGGDPQNIPVQYHIVNQLPTQTEGADTLTAVVNRPTAAVLPANVQLPSGCEIYLVKEYVETNTPTTNRIANNTLVTASSHKSYNKATTTTDLNAEQLKSVNSRAVKIDRNALEINKDVPQLNVTPNGTVAGHEPSTKSSYLLEAYKKRDDKRRATHNEVERRRRDKINSWIFKLKEMLPKDNSTTTSSVVLTPLKNEGTQQTVQQRQIGSNSNTCRTPISDSKSQILIKACEYIKTMQEQYKRCLTENENLRMNNQRLQNELNKLKCNQNLANNNNCLSSSGNQNFNITLNNLNANNTIFGSTTSTNTTAGLAGTGHGTATYTKRELIIRDYVD